MVLANMFRDLKKKNNGHLMFGLPRHTMKGKCHDFICHKQRNQLQQVQYH